MHHRYFQIAGITIRFEVDFNLEKSTFKPAIACFSIEKPGADIVTLHRYFKLPDLNTHNLGNLIYQTKPWTIYENKSNGHQYYLRLSPDGNLRKLKYFADFNEDFTFGKIYSQQLIKQRILNDGWLNLTGFASDSMWLTQLLVNRSALNIHSASAILNGNGLMFIGRSEAGKTTTTRLLQHARDRDNASVSILCDETNIARRNNGKWRVYGTWGHGEEEEVSPLSAPLKGIFVLRKDKINKISRLSDKKQILRQLLSVVFRPLMTKSWWEKEINILNQLINEVPMFEMYFDKTGRIIHLLDALDLD